jgi:hypothetical protein
VVDVLVDACSASLNNGDDDVDAVDEMHEISDLLILLESYCVFCY